MTARPDPETAGMSDLGRRLSERQSAAARGTAPPAMTARDRANLEAFTETLDALSDTLRAEISEIEARNLPALEPLLARKTALFQTLEGRFGAVAPFLRAEIAGNEALRARLETLGSLVAADRRLLERIAAAAGQIASEHARILDRHSLNGLYEKTGRKIGASRAGSRNFDESH